MKNEQQVRQMLTEHYTRQQYFDVKSAVEGSLSIEGASRRVARMQKFLPANLDYANSKILVSGMGAGSEMIAARNAGFAAVSGTETDGFSVEVCRLRLSGMEGFSPVQVDHAPLPLPNDEFSVVLSGHVIEHTGSPEFYIEEHLRVLANGGYFYMEFPTRFHHTELHTGLPSVEWLPTFLRNALLKWVGYGSLRLDAETKRKCRVILETGLKSVSVGMVVRCAKRKAKIRVLAKGKAESGVAFLMLQKVG